MNIPLLLVALLCAGLFFRERRLRRREKQRFQLLCELVRDAREKGNRNPASESHPKTAGASE
jgi:hypothetical protein